MKGRALPCWVFPAAGWLLTAACTSRPLDEPSLGREEGGGGSSGSGSRTPGFGESECGECVATECSGERTACSAEPGCANYLGCLEACSVAEGGNVDAACEAACSRPQAGAEKSAFDDYSTCRSSASCTACGDGAGGTGGSPGTGILGQQCEPSTSANACLRCVDEGCCKTTAAFDLSSEAVLLDDCLDACEDAPCKEACLDEWPAEVETVLEYGACIAMRCGTPDACGSSDLLACVTTNCAEVYVACQTDPDCFLLKQCRIDCTNGSGTSACYEACDAAATPAAIEKYEQYGLCLGNQCS